MEMEIPRALAKGKEMQLQSFWCESGLVLQKRWAPGFGEAAEVPELGLVEYPLGWYPVTEGSSF